MNGEWWYEAKCAGREVEFTELPRGRYAQDVIADLIYVCFTCPVIRECKKETDRNPPSGGIVQAGELWP